MGFLFPLDQINYLLYKITQIHPEPVILLIPPNTISEISNNNSYHWKTKWGEYKQTDRGETLDAFF